MAADTPTRDHPARSRLRRPCLGLLGAALCLALLATACGDDDGDTSAAASAPASGAASSPSSIDGYQPVSDVTSHAAIGGDIAAIKDFLAVAKDGGEPDWAGVRAGFSQGGASRKGDGTLRTLATLLVAPDDIAFIETALDGEGNDAVRAQQVEKGITVLVTRKVIQELEAAGDKLADGDTDPEEGAPHNVDEAWAFYLADGNGPSSTAQKRAADFGLEGKVDEAVLAGLLNAQRAALDGDADAFDEAAAEVRSALNYIFYLATYKYLDVQDDEVRRAEGQAFYRGIAPILVADVPAAHTAITTAFATGDTRGGRASLNDADTLAALGISTDAAVSG